MSLNSLGDCLALADRLFEIKSRGDLQENRTADYIIRRLREGDVQAARNEFYHDGDKLPTFTMWGREFVAVLHMKMGCRVHGVPGCEHWLCARITRDFYTLNC